MLVCKVDSIELQDFDCICTILHSCMQYWAVESVSGPGEALRELVDLGEDLDVILQKVSYPSLRKLQLTRNSSVLRSQRPTLCS